MPRNVPPGPGVDASGQTVVDPTRNVRELVDLNVKRLDDLRVMESRYLREIMEIRTENQEKLSLAETARINAIRAVDVGAAAILAGQVAASAEALRGQVEAARQQTAVGLAAALEPIQKDIQDLRRAQYEAQGVKANVTDRRLDTNTIIAWLVAAAAVAAFVFKATGH